MSIFLKKILKVMPFCIAAVISGHTLAIPYQVLMDDVVSANWADMHDGVGDLYDTGSVKQIDVNYQERVTWGNSATGDPDPQFWESLQYGNNHKAIFANQGGTEVLEVEINGLNGHTVELKQVILGRWYPDAINTLGSDWRLYDGAWNLLDSGNTVMTDFVDYFLNFNFGSFDTLRFQLGHDNWDNGIIGFTFDTDVANGVLDLVRDDIEAPTPNVPVTPPNINVSEPSISALFALCIGLLMLRGRERGFQ